MMALLSAAVRFHFLATVSALNFSPDIYLPYSYAEMPFLSRERVMPALLSEPSD